MKKRGMESCPPAKHFGEPLPGGRAALVSCAKGSSLSNRAGNRNPPTPSFGRFPPPVLEELRFQGEWAALRR